jgi:hypothetical protein
MFILSPISEILNRGKTQIRIMKTAFLLSVLVLVDVAPCGEVDILKDRE